MNKNHKPETKPIKTVPIMLILILGAFITTLNQTVMSVATPELMTDFNISAATAQWLTTGYMLVNGILVPVTAYLMVRFTLRQLFQASMIIFLVGTIVAALATGFPVLLSGRLIQAAGAGMIMPLIMQVALTLFPPEKRGGIMGIVGLALVVAPAIGPTLAGFILDKFNWQTMFYGMIPVAVLVIVLGFIFLQNIAERIKIKLDILSVALSTLGFGGMLYGFSRAGSLGWSSFEVLSTITVGIIALAAFAWKQLKSQNPLLDLRAFKYNMFSLTTVISILVTMVMYADMILLPLYLQNIRGYSALESGLFLLPGALLMGLLMPVAGKLFDRFGAKWLSVIGMVLIIGSTLSFINLTDTTSYTYLLIMATIRRMGMGLLLMPIQTAGFNQLPTSLNAHGTAISNTVQRVAGAIGTSLFVTVMSDRTKTHFQDTAANGIAQGISEQKLMTDASIQGINDAFLIIIGIGVITLLLSFFIKKVKEEANIAQSSQ
ncbi:DHA2 family efflux MFS transporter permease subunit (plasmid) [Paenibacillus cellulosilyticus]|nr:DHA2 family efflux MFS transporter permease subunit [Paenibacillus cellulosilyticus]QKS48896.1 DHA2 family efflux MFS transporter permease subunit [Paenibacillus cellulosilyticus]